MSNGVLEAVGKLHLNWCVAIAFNGSKFGGWVSENYLALARLAEWFFSLLPFLTPGPPYRDPTRPLMGRGGTTVNDTAKNSSID